MIRINSRRLAAQVTTVLATLVTWLGSATAGESTAPKSPAPDVSKLPSGGFALDFELWQPAGHGKPKALVITYTWGGLTRTVEASRQNDRWHAEFPAEPAAHEQATLILRYSFEMSDADWTRVRAAETELVGGILDAIHAAAAKDIDVRQKAKAANALAAKNKQDADSKLADAEDALKKATAELAAAEKDANDARTNLANATAEKKAEAEKEAKQKDDARVAAVTQLEDAKQAEQAAKARQAAATKAAESPIVAEPKFAENFAAASKSLQESKAAATLRQYGNNDQNGLELLLQHLGIAESQSGWEVTLDQKQTLIDVASGWVATNTDLTTREVVEGVKAIGASKADKGCEPPKDAALDELTDEQANALFKACVAFLAQQPESKEPELSKALAGVATATGEDRAILMETVQSSKLGQTRSALLARLAERTLHRSDKSKAQRALLTPLVAGLDTAFAEGGRKEDGATLIKGAAKPRRYDIATGAVYVHALQDVIVPSLVTICLWEGCLDPTEVAWNAQHGWGRAFSLDAGIRVKTIGTQDRRQSDTVSFLIGASYNPVSILRVSAGLYAFENAQKDAAGQQPWQLTPYVGATLNVLNAATILGSIGLNNDLSPTASSVK